MKEVSNKVSFPKIEEGILKFWNENDLFKKSISNRLKNNEFIFYDGPPFATGLPHYGHLLAGTIKDVIPRYKTMKGFRVDRRFGWDCHGLPVEFEMEKTLNLNGRHDIEEYGIAKFNEQCRSIVLRYTSQWRATVERMGRWVDFDNDYKTMDINFMESVWNVFKTLYEKGFIYKGLKVVPYSWRVSTPLSNFEANLNYKDIQDPSVTIKFKINQTDNDYFLAWTTTPWTLPSNLALCVHPSMDYVKIKVHESAESYYLAQSRLNAYFEESEYEVLKTLKGASLVGKTYEPLFKFAVTQNKAENAFVMLSDDYVTDDSGTGIVHQAPAFGEDDLRVCLKANIKAFDPVDVEGNFNETMGFIAKTNIKVADKLIIKNLKEQNKLFKHQTIQHSYPFCWRTDTPLIYKAISTWFVNVEKIKDDLIVNNKQIGWIPGHIKQGRFGKWLENARDWAISRNRFWGTPLPIWESEDGEILCFGSVAEIETASGQKIDDIHKHFMDKITFEKDGKTYTRVNEVLDCWFESGSMPYAQNHYPFENKEQFDNNFPADFICEGLDQTRGWFYTLMVISTAMFNKPAFKNVIVNGLILAEDGKKMSKREKNYPDPNEMINKYGADSVRLYMLNSVAVRGDDLRFSENGLLETTRSLLLPLWNALAFLSTYAQIDNWQPSKGILEHSSENPMDRWIISRLNSLIQSVEKSMDAYELNQSVSPLVGFINLLTNWYIRRSRRRFWKSGIGEDKLSAYSTLYNVLHQLSHLMAPFIPFTADAIYKNLVDDEQASVHLNNFPIANTDKIDKALNAKMELVLSAVNMGRSLRAKHQIKIRQPLGKIFLVTRDPSAKGVLEELNHLITEELNVKEVLITDNEQDLVHLSVKANFKTLGKRFGKNMKDAATVIAKFDGEAIDTLIAGDTLNIDVSGNSEAITQNDVVIQREQKEGLLVLSENNVTVALDTTLNDDLINEGLAREFINKVQNMRKETNLDVMDRIEITFNTDAKLKFAVSTFDAFVKTETLANAIHFSAVDNAKTWDVNQIDCDIAIVKC